MQLNELKSNTPRKAAVRVGRGGKRGKTAGRGHKGQKARAGHRIRPAQRDIIRKLPKLRGHGVNRSRTVNSGRAVAQAVNLGTLDRIFAAGESVSPQTLLAKGAVRREGGRTPVVKILASGELSKKLTISGCKVSATARAAVEKAGGEILE